MPTYDYRCEACGHELELFQNISEAPKKKCPACKKPKLKRKIGGGAGFLFKGSGFYLTDYRSDSYKKAAEADSKPAAPGPGSSDSSGGAKADGKSAAPAPKPSARHAPHKDKEKKSKK
jgi:putative FmdB family regulatory protein